MNPELTKKELEILKMFLVVDSFKEIAEKQCVSYLTIKGHVSNIYQKLGVCTGKNGVSLGGLRAVQKAVQNGYLTPEEVF